MTAGQNVNRLIGVFGRELLGPGLVELDAIDRRDDVNADGGNTYLENEMGGRKVVDRQILKGCAERGQSTVHEFRICGSSSNPHIEIFGRPNMTVSGQRESTDHQILSVDGVQRGKQISEV